jgi:hypothetical protein
MQSCEKQRRAFSVTREWNEIIGCDFIRVGGKYARCENPTSRT